MDTFIKEPATLLLVDDDSAVIQACSRLLADFGRCRFARQAADAWRILNEERIELVLLDAEMPGESGLDLLLRLQADPHLANVPVILLTSHRDEATEETAFAHGAVDFITKPVRPTILRARVNTQLRLKRAQDRLQILARTDALTGLANRRAGMERLRLELGRARRDGKPLSLLSIDVDHFKRYNDHYGHPAGDQVLQQVGQCLAAVAGRAADLAVRWGGEEFLLLLPGTDLLGAQAVADALHARVREAAIAHVGGEQGRLTLSVGVAEQSGRAPQQGASNPDGDLDAGVEALLARADAALYAAKQGGRNRSALAASL